MKMKQQMFITIAIAAAFMAISIAMPDTAAAWDHWWDWHPDRSAPEVDPSTLGSAIAIALGGWAVLSDKLRRH